MNYLCIFAGMSEKITNFAEEINYVLKHEGIQRTGKKF